MSALINGHLPLINMSVAHKITARGYSIAARAYIAGSVHFVPLSPTTVKSTDIHILTPGRFIGAEAQEIEAEPFEVKRLIARLREQQVEAAKPDDAINPNLKELGYD